MNVLTALLSAVGSFFAWKSSKEKQTEDAESTVAKAKKKSQKADERIDAAVYGGDKDAVNRLIALTLAAVGGTVAIALGGCSVFLPHGPTNIYIPSDRECVPMVRTNIVVVAEGTITNTNFTAGWFVPNAVMSELLKYKQRNSELQDKIDVLNRMK